MRAMHRLPKAAGLGALALVLVLALAGMALASDKGSLVFAPGTSSASVKGDIQGMDRDTWQVKAKAGQTMTVSVKNAKKLVLFHIQLPGTEDQYLPGAGTDDDATAWKGKLPSDGVYTIIVGAMKGSDTKYVLDVAITN